MVEKNSFECNICFISFDGSDRKPLILLCGHTFCTKCINDLKEIARKKGFSSFQCPTCREHDSLDYEFKTNYYVLELLSQSNLKREQPVQQNQVRMPLGNLTNRDLGNQSPSFSIVPKITTT